MLIETSKGHHVLLRGNNLFAHQDIAKQAYNSAKNKFGIKATDENRSVHIQDDDNGIVATVTAGDKTYKATLHKSKTHSSWKWEGEKEAEPDEEEEPAKPIVPPAPSVSSDINDNKDEQNDGGKENP